MLMVSDIHGNWEIYFLRIIECYMLTVENCEKVLEVSNDVVDWVLPQFQPIKDTSVYFTINKMIQVCAGKVDEFKRIDALGTSIYHGYTYDMFINPALNVFSTITYVGCNFRGKNHIMIHLNFFKHCFYEVR